jgi:hypothetical protein
MLVRSGIMVVKYWFSITDQEQQLRFLMRIHDPMKQWKLSPMDLQSRVRWEQYTKAKEEMFERTNIEEANWFIVEGNDKKKARLNCIRHLLSLVPYTDVAQEDVVLPDRVFENRGPLTLPQGWGASPVLYQLFGLRDTSTGGDLNKLALVGGYTRTGGPTPTFGADGGAAADGRLWNIFRLKENVRRTRSLGVDTVPWWNYIPAAGVQTGIVPVVPMESADHIDVLAYWREQGVRRFILWGSPARDFNDDPESGPLVDYYESDFKVVIDEILPSLVQPPASPIRLGGRSLRRRAGAARRRARR